MRCKQVGLMCAGNEGQWHCLGETDGEGVTTVGNIVSVLMDSSKGWAGVSQLRVNEARAKQSLAVVKKMHGVEKHVHKEVVDVVVA